MSALGEAVRAAMNADSSVTLVGASVGRGGGAGGWASGLRAAFGPERVIDVPVADRAAIGLATGLAIGGRRVLVEIDGPGRLAAILEGLSAAAQIQLAGGFSVGLVVLVPYGTEAGSLDQPVGRWLHRIPGLSVVCGSSPGNLAGLATAALAAGRPVVALAPRALLGMSAGAPEQVSLDRAREVRAGDQVTLASWGTGVSVAVDASDRLASEGISAGVVDLVSLAPLDREGLGEVVRRTGRLVVVHPDDPALAGDVASIGLDEAFLSLEAPLARVSSSSEAVAGAARGCVNY
jgi:pyruvate/2-oxoglutarate/acetoin dehydrogenase E1 component